MYERFIRSRQAECLSYGAGALAGMVTRRLLEAAWKVVRHTSGPPVPADRRSSWPEALSWAVASGVGMSVSRFFAIRTAAAVWGGCDQRTTTGSKKPSQGSRRRAECD
ncbi:MAG: DUF4235 domain-containing protein [Acidimicrobiales bacterium]